eukprot:8637132-Pyramimonas_sp.AAC.1
MGEPAKQKPNNIIGTPPYSGHTRSIAPGKPEFLPLSLTGVLAGTFSSLACCTPTPLFQSVSAE